MSGQNCVQELSFKNESDLNKLQTLGLHKEKSGSLYFITVLPTEEGLQLQRPGLMVTRDREGDRENER